MFSKKQKLFLAGVIIILIIIIISGTVFYLGDRKALQRKMDWGVTFSIPYASRLALDWQKVYLAMLDELGVDNIRLPVYWDELEKERGRFDFSEVDWQVREAAKRGAAISMVVGRRVPRWPECWEPDWTKRLSDEKIKKEILVMVAEVVRHYKNEPAIKYWQVENEPLLDVFGECPSSDIELLKKEIKLVRSLDNRPIIITESGELSTWRRGSNLADILGVSMYRVVWNKYYGYFHWFLPPAYYRIKARLAGRDLDNIFNTELQLEPWAPTGMVWRTPVEEQYKSMSLSQFKKNINFARRTGFRKTYLWGVEWWYFMKEKRGVDIFWREAGKLWKE